LTTSGKGLAKGRSVPLWSAALAAALLCAGPSRAIAGSEIQPSATGPDSAFASLRVETLPPGLLVLLDGVKVGRSPVGPLWLPAKMMRVQALPEDPRRFEPGRDGAVLTLARGRDTTLVLDLRPSVLVRSAPEPALLTLLVVFVWVSRAASFSLAAYATVILGTMSAFVTSAHGSSFMLDSAFLH